MTCDYFSRNTDILRANIKIVNSTFCSIIIFLISVTVRLLLSLLYIDICHACHFSSATVKKALPPCPCFYINNNIFLVSVVLVMSLMVLSVNFATANKNDFLRDFKASRRTTGMSIPDSSSLHSCLLPP